MRKLEQLPDLGKEDITKLFAILYDRENNQLIEEINEKYLFWDKVKYKAKSNENTPEQIWGAVKLSRLLKEPQKVSFGKYSFTYNLTNSIQNDLHLFDLNMGGSLGSKSVIPDKDKNTYLISSIMEEAIASSQIEGAVTTRKQAKEMLKKGRAPKNKSEQMIVNNYKTIEYILSIKEEPLTMDRLREIHRIVTKRTLNDPNDEGNFRQSNDVNVVDVTDGEVVHSPPEYPELEALLTGLCNFFNDGDQKTFTHPIVKACIIHFMTGFIHPFVDGNGRTARALFYWYLLSQNYWLTEYLSISRIIIKSKEQYANAFLFSEADSNDLTYFILYNIKVMRLAYEELKKYIQLKIEEKKQLIHFQKISGINERQALILKWVYEEPELILTVKEIEIRLSVSNATARNDLYNLVEGRFLEILNPNNKPHNFCKSHHFDEIISEKMKK